ncbi:hypothetical protein [Aquella oligotrophica]|uniref:Uncharacterized protein n=1 Tax=Aquella oligotrophica TaxID=2067065 RepID=A0A2I7N968_9NEIS|nr:hypothetical protein [Aquella oligotrophica]AUR52981.1 hypothetical protein CUN60_11985 [Aquella oligotrophica]
MANTQTRKRTLLLRIPLLFLIGTVLLGEVACHAVAQTQPPSSNYNDWSWFKDTYWIVPEQGIYSIAHNPSNPREFNVLRGQTVFHLTDYFNGYFTGAVVVKLTQNLVPSCQYVLGEVTPQGAVYMTMFNADDGTITNEPIGNMVLINNKWTMVNTMTGPANNGGSVSHWAYMVLTQPSDPTWSNLPFANESIPEFMSACPPGPMISL